MLYMHILLNLSWVFGFSFSQPFQSQLRQWRLPSFVSVIFFMPFVKFLLVCLKKHWFLIWSLAEIISLSLLLHHVIFVCFCFVGVYVFYLSSPTSVVSHPFFFFGGGGVEGESKRTWAIVTCRAICLTVLSSLLLFIFCSWLPFIAQMKMFRFYGTQLWVAFILIILVDLFFKGRFYLAWVNLFRRDLAFFVCFFAWSFFLIFCFWPYFFFNNSLLCKNRDSLLAACL